MWLLRRCEIRFYVFYKTYWKIAEFSWTSGVAARNLVSVFISHGLVDCVCMDSVMQFQNLAAVNATAQISS